MARNAFDVSYDVKGYNRVQNMLRALASAHPNVTDPIIGKHVKQQAKDLRGKPYPPMLPNQKYKRTGILGKRFRAQHRGKGQWAVINRVPYAVWVIKKGMQNRKYHLGRWWTLEDEMDASMPELTRNLTVALENEIEKQTD